VKDQDRPAVWAKLRITVDVDGQPLTEVTAPTATATDGTAAVRFTLPKTDDLKDARVSVTVTTAGVVETLVRRVPLATKTLALEFFPEGGDLVAGVPNRVYFRATTAFGKPADVRGTLTDGTRDIAAVETLTDAEHPGANQGLGAVTFTPENGKRYAVRLDRPIGVNQPDGGFPLPLSKADGVVLHVPNGVTKPGQPLAVKLWNAGPRREVLVGVYVRGQAAGHRRAVLDAGKVTELALDLGAMRIGGVTRVTVFEDPDGEAVTEAELKPLAERLVYRHPGETLNLAVTAGPGAFAPGHRVRLDIRAKTETDAPAPAVLWAAVVNQSVLTMADEKAERLLPTHFLLGGEVQNPDDLEHADFLLTDHPRATESLDLLLGTQGWRRFAEQAPDRFRKTTPDADRLLVAMGAGPVPMTWRTGVRQVFDDYWPRYDAAVTGLEAAEVHHVRAVTDPDVMAALRQAEQELEAQNAKFGTAAYRLKYFDAAMTDRREWLPAAIFVLVGGAVGLIALRSIVGKDSGLRRPLARGAVGVAVLAGFLVVCVGITSVGNDHWRTHAARAPKPVDSNPWGGNFAQQNAPPPVPAAAVPDLAFAEKALPPDFVPKMVPGALRKAAPFAVPGAGDEPRLVNFDLDGWPRAARPVLLPQAFTEAVRRTADDAPDEPFAERVADLARTHVPQLPPLVIREYAHVRKTPPIGDEDARTDFTETLFWHPVLVAGPDGTATASFQLSDAVAPYRVLVAGHTLDGRIGASSHVIEVRKPIVVEPKLPQEIGSADVLDVPVQITAGPEVRSAKLSIAPDGLTVDDGPPDRTVTLAGGGRAFVRLSPYKSEGSLALRLTASAGPGLTDTVERRFAVTPDGFPHAGTTADVLEGVFRAPVTVPKHLIPGTLKVTVTVYPNTLAELQAGLDGLLREPSGCFEQSSTTNYPNVLITEYLRESGQANPDLSRRTKELMDRGYTRLTGFECPDTPAKSRKGFEWFGAPDAPHEALTAYGLLQFTDMARVYPVDPAVLKRTRDYLTAARDGAGGFARNARHLDRFGGAPPHVTNAYIAWAVTEADKTAAADLGRELDALVKQAKSAPAGKDPYFLALAGTALLTAGRTADALELLTA
ncbi:MAG: alpha-2-macroglobulin family protein, partial [Fimbriiglobus sp.]